jgi:N-acetylglutamate synthase-like GNAT family acetyltransferase
MDRGAIYLLLEEENQTCGCVAYEIIGNDLCYLERLAVLPQKRKQGLGGKLINHVLNAAKQSGAERVSIGIISEQTELKKWYEKSALSKRTPKSLIIYLLWSLSCLMIWSRIH